MDTLNLIELVLQAIGFASLLLQVIPTLDKNNKIKPVLKFLGTYVALNKPVIRDYADLVFKKLKR
jgi:hypothetical protein